MLSSLSRWTLERIQAGDYVETVEESIWQVRVGVDNMCLVEEIVWQVGMFSIIKLEKIITIIKNVVMIYLLPRIKINSPKTFLAPKIVCSILKAQILLNLMLFCG